MATPKKLKSGNWRTQVYLGKKDGKNVYVSVTAPTKAECAYKAAEIKRQGLPEDKPESMTVGQAVDKYIESCDLLSPTTVAGYEKIRRTMFQDLMECKVDELSDMALQAAVSAESKRKSRRGTTIAPKYIRNAYGLISTALRRICNLSFTVKLPEDPPKFLELPEPADVIRAIRGSEIELPCMLAIWLSLSMSEIRGLKYSSIRNGCIYIDQVVVDVDNQMVEKKNAKVRTRNRCLALPEYIMQLIHDTTDYDKYLAGEITDFWLIELRHEYQIRQRLKKLVPGITFHQLRHLNASVMLQLNIPEKYAMERGGWSTPSTMKRVYQHTFSAERQRVDHAIDGYFDDILQEISHKSTHETPQSLEK